MEHGTCSGLFPGRMYGDAAGCFGLHSNCNGMSGLVSTCRHEPLELWQKVLMSVGVKENPKTKNEYPKAITGCDFPMWDEQCPCNGRSS